jgi:hypothetical protein
MRLVVHNQITNQHFLACNVVGIEITPFKVICLVASKVESYTLPKDYTINVFDESAAFGLGFLPFPWDKRPNASIVFE